MLSTVAVPADEMPEPAAVPCIVCGGRACTVVCTGAEIAAQLAFLRRFHRHRLRVADADALAERAEFTHDETPAVAACCSCGQLFRNLRRRNAAVRAEYAGDSYGGDRLASLFAAQRQLFRGKVARLARVLAGTPQPQIVEIGSFVGGFLAAAREQGWAAVGIDPGEEVTAFCRAQGLEVQRNTADEAAIDPRSVDCVAIWNTFDQLPDPRPALRAARRWLKRDGLLVVRVPNGAVFRAAAHALHRLDHRLRAPLLIALAWNNLLGFPYLQGYRLDTLDRLLGELDFARCEAVPDMLVRLSDEHTRAWAVWEEAASKRLWRLIAWRRPRAAPWFDAYYRLAADGRDVMPIPTPVPALAAV